MAVNHKLTHVVKDRVVQNFQLNAPELLIRFVDGSTMNIKIVESNSPPLHEGARIRQISEDRATIVIECEDDSAFDVTIVDPGSSVAVRDKNQRACRGENITPAFFVGQSGFFVPVIKPT